MLLRDPIGANLDRMQIIKGWLDADGEVARAQFTTSLFQDGRKIGADGRCTQVPCRQARWTWKLPPGSNTIGASELLSVWTDPDFDRTQSAPSTTCVSLRSRLLAGFCMIRSAWVPRFLKVHSCRDRSAPTLLRSGTHQSDSLIPPIWG